MSELPEHVGTEIARLNEIDDLVARLRAEGIRIECAASTLNSLAPRVETGQAASADFTLAISDHQFVREQFRETLAQLTGQSATWIERVLAL